MKAAASSCRTWMNRMRSRRVRSASMMPLMPSPGRPKTTSTPQSWIVSISTSAAVWAMTGLLSSARRGRRGLGRATAGRRGVVEDLAHGADDRGAADAVALEQLPWRAAPRDLAHGQAVDDDAGVGQRLRHR